MQIVIIRSLISLLLIVKAFYVNPLMGVIGLYAKRKKYVIIINMQVSKNSKYENKKRKKIQKEHFYPNHYHREAIHDCMNEFGSMIKNSNYSKTEIKKIQQSVKRLRGLALLPVCSKHYFGMD